MKKYISCAIFLLCTFLISSCDSDVNHPIVGHTYGVSEGNEYIALYFSESHTCLVQIYTATQTLNNSHFTYTIKDTSVDIYFDKSEEWIESARGTLLLHLTYNVSDNTLSYLGDKLYFIN